MNKRPLLLSIVFPILLVAVLFRSGSQELAARPDPWIDRTVLSDIDQQGRADVLILLSDHPDLSPAYSLPTKEARGQWVYDTLRRAALADQTELVDELKHAGAPFQQFWAVNAVRTSVDARTLTRIQGMPAVQRIQSDRQVRGIAPLPVEELEIASVDATSWGVDRVEAPWAWNQGYTGQGIVVAGQDTGYDWEHPALKHSFRGYDAQLDTVDFNYHWHDSIHEDLSGNEYNRCGYDSEVACDDDKHGTHTMGTMVGNDLTTDDPNWPAGAENVIGVAPGAKWIGCRNMEQQVGRPSTYIECFEWLTAPYPLGGDPLTDGDPSKAPDIINNSWGCPPPSSPSPFIECEDDHLEVIEPAVDAADAAGIVVVSSAGNYGSACGTILDPPAIYPRSLVIGATSSNDSLASFSSNGWVSYDGKTKIKPDLTAPGISIRSSVPGDGYRYERGTSMASPHVVGVIALLLSAEPELQGHTELIKTIVSRTAEPVLDFACGGDSSGRPNNRFGWGIVNARQAVESLSQTGYLAGKLKNVDEEPLKGIKVYAYDRVGVLAGTATTDGLGSYSLPLSWGEYHIRVESSSSGAAYVVGGQTTELDIILVETLLHLPMIMQ